MDEESARGAGLLTIALLVLFVLLAFSDDIAAAVAELFGLDAPTALFVALVDVVLIGVVLALGMAAKSQVRWAWYVGAGCLHVGLDLWVLDQPAERRDVPEFVVVASAAYALTLALLAAALVGWRRLPGRRPVSDVTGPDRQFGVVLLLAVGTFAAYLAGEYWDALWRGNADSPPPGVNSQFFQQASQVIPLLLVAIGLQARYLPRQANRAIGQAAMIVTISLLCLAEALVLTLLPQMQTSDTWHGYATFVVVMEAGLVGLALLLWESAAVVIHLSKTAPARSAPDGEYTSESGAAVDGPATSDRLSTLDSNIYAAPLGGKRTAAAAWQSAAECGLPAAQSTTATARRGPGNGPAVAALSAAVMVVGISWLRGRCQRSRRSS